MITLVLEPHRTKIGELVADYPADHCQSAHLSSYVFGSGASPPATIGVAGTRRFPLALGNCFQGLGSCSMDRKPRWAEAADRPAPRSACKRLVQTQGLGSAQRYRAQKFLERLPSATSSNFGSVELGKTTAETSTLSAAGGSCHNPFRSNAKDSRATEPVSGMGSITVVWCQICVDAHERRCLQLTEDCLAAAPRQPR